MLSISIRKRTKICPDEKMSWNPFQTIFDTYFSFSAYETKAVYKYETNYFYWCVSVYICECVLCIGVQS